MQEAGTKYVDGIPIADVRSTSDALRGRELEGQTILHIPVQTSPVPREVLAFAKKLRVEIIDPTGKVYR